jgi:DNA-binding MarR family transcriptional regulator
MSNVRKKSSPVEAQQPVGVLLRLTFRMIRERQFNALIESGFDDLNGALLNVTAYLGPGGMHPSDLAARTNMTKQAINYLLGRLETLGYIKRRAEKPRSSTLVFLTRRGRRAAETTRDAACRVEAEWVTLLGQKRFSEFLDTLRKLSSDDTYAGSAQPSRATGGFK